MPASEKPHSRFRHVYAIVRIDLPVSEEHPENSVSVVKVLSSQVAAQQETLRLNTINSGKACRYVLQTTRLVQFPN